MNHVFSTNLHIIWLLCKPNKLKRCQHYHSSTIRRKNCKKDKISNKVHTSRLHVSGVNWINEMGLRCTFRVNSVGNKVIYDPSAFCVNSLIHYWRTDKTSPLTSREIKSVNHLCSKSRRAWKITEHAFLAEPSQPPCGDPWGRKWSSTLYWW